MFMYTIYEKPKDYPSEFVCRQQEILPGEVRQGRLVAVHHTLAGVRGLLHNKVPGLERVPRHPTDDTVIVESWL